MRPLDAGSRDDSQRGELFLVRRISLFLRPAHGPYAGGDGFSYGRSLLFVLKMSLFAGVLAGVGQFVLVNWIDPEGFREQFDLMVANMAGGGMGEKEAEMAGSPDSN